MAPQPPPKSEEEISGHEPFANRRAHPATGPGDAVAEAKVIASRWGEENDPGHEAFVDWTKRYRTATPDDRASLAAEGVVLAKARRRVLAEWIQDDPRRALAAAVPLVEREILPPEVLAHLEERVGGPAEFSLNAAIGPDGEPADVPVFRSALVNRKEYLAHPYGRRAALATVESLSLHGIALDGHLAVSDSPLRILEPGENPGERPFEDMRDPSHGPVAPLDPAALDEVVAVEANGMVAAFCCPSHLAAFAAQLTSLEHPPDGPSAGDDLPGSSAVAGRPPLEWTTGPKSVLLIRVDFSDLPGTPVHSTTGTPAITPDYAVDRFNAPNGVRDFYEQNSYGLTTIMVAPTSGGVSPDVTPVLRMPSTASSYATTGANTLLHNDARAAAAGVGYPVADYDRVGVIFTRVASVPGSLITYGGLGNIQGRNFWINGSYSFGTVAHELGHNYGLPHANLWKVTDGNPVSPAGASFEYGDPSDLMGSAGASDRHFNHWFKNLLHWIPDSSVPTVTESAVHRIHRMDAPGASPTNTLAIKVPREPGVDYWIGYRRGAGLSAFENGAYALWGYSTRRQSNLLDLTTPGTGSGSEGADDAALAVGQTFHDTAAGITLQTLARGGSDDHEWIDVAVTLQPRLVWDRVLYPVDETTGGVTVAVRRISNATGAISVNYATANGTAAAPGDYAATTGTLTWADGDDSPREIPLTIVPDSLTEGVETFTVVLSHPYGAVIAGDSSTTVQIADAGARDPLFAPDFLNSSVDAMVVEPDGSLILGGFFSTAQDKGFQLYPRGKLARYLPDGDLDSSFAEDGGAENTGRVNTLARQPDGRILAGGTFTTMHGETHNRLVRLMPDGSLDPSFDIGSGFDDIVESVLVQPDGHILVGGRFSTFNGEARHHLVRLRPDGSLDTSFAPTPFETGAGWYVACLALQPDNRILVGGQFYRSGPPPFRSGLVRLLPDGTPDPSFNGVTQGAHAEGNPSFLQIVRSLGLLPDGRIVIGGGFTAFNNQPRGRFAVLTSNGALSDLPTAGFDDIVNGVLPLPGGGFLATGWFTQTTDGAPAAHVARIHADGTFDSAFSQLATRDSIGVGLKLDGEGRVLVYGLHAIFGDAPSSRPVARFFPGIPGLPGTVRWTAGTAFGNAGASLIVSAERTGGSTGPVSVNYATVAGATPPDGFTVSTGTFSWADGETGTRSLDLGASAGGPGTFTANLGEPLVGGVFPGSLQRLAATVAPSPGDLYEIWRETHFTPGELADPSISGDLADPDHDGVPNLLELALGLPPRTPDTSGLPAAAIHEAGGQKYLSLTFTRRIDVGLSYRVKTSATLEAGSWVEDAVLVSAINHANGTETVVYRTAAAMTDPDVSRRFMRVEVSR